MDKTIEVPSGWREEKYGWTILYFDEAQDLRYVYASESDRVGGRHEAVLYEVVGEESIEFYRDNDHKEAEEILQTELNEHHTP